MLACDRDHSIRCSDVADEIASNLTGLITVTAAALPALPTAPQARVVNIGSGLGFVPLVAAPVYSATKAAVHSFSLSLRRPLATTTVQVVEIVPPVVETSLHRNQSRRPPGAMPLEAFLDGATRGLDAGSDEFGVGQARMLRIGARMAPRRFLGLINRSDGKHPECCSKLAERTRVGLSSRRHRD